MTVGTTIHRLIIKVTSILILPSILDKPVSVMANLQFEKTQRRVK